MNGSCSCTNQIAVVVFPKPEELNLRIAKKLEGTGTGLPADEVNNMLGIL